MLRWWQLCTLSGLLAATSARAQELPPPDAVKELKQTLTQLDEELQRIQQLAKQLSRISKSTDKAAKTQSLSASIAKAGAISDMVTAQEAYRRGVVEEERLQYDQAVSSFTRAIQLDPKNDSALLHRGRMYFELGNFKLAVEDLTASLTIQPNNARAYDLRAQANRAQKSYDHAIADWREAALRDPRNALHYLLSQATVEEDRGNLPQALEIYDQASRQDPGSAEVRLRRAATLKKQNRMEEAVRECTAAVELDSSDARGYVCRADGYVRLSRLPMAISDLDQAIRLNPMVPEASALISAVWQRLELNAEAQQLSAPAQPVSTPSARPTPAVTPAGTGPERAEPAPVVSTTTLSIRDRDRESEQQISLGESDLASGGPKPIRQTNPRVRSKPGTEVQVRVEIDASGEVRSATPLNETLSNSFVANAAAEAAKSWRFEPARDKGHPVASTMILIFRFAAK